jgi:hypothetical protein
MGCFVSALPKDEDSWQQLLTYLPNGWDSKAKELGALKRIRNFSSESLLRTLLIHLLNGYSLRETATCAQMADIADVSDVALLKRLNSSGDWFKWLSQELMYKWHEPNRKLFNRPVIAVDGTHVSEPGSTGSCWRIHYGFDIKELKCVDVKITENDIGESLKNYDIQKGSVILADRGYYSKGGIAFANKNGSYVVIRMSMRDMTLYNETGKPLDTLKFLRTIHGTEAKEIPVYIKNGADQIKCRICAVKKSPPAIKKSVKKLFREHSKKQRKGKVSKDLLESSQYFFVITTIPQSELSAKQVLELYRSRWQIELVFKRLKSIIGLGHLPKQDPTGARAWLHGKLFCAFLVEALICSAERFSPWGFEIEKEMV